MLRGIGRMLAARCYCRNREQAYVPFKLLDAPFSTAHAIEPPPHVETPPVNTTGLPLAERCKNLLAANWRCQLATVKTEEEFSVTSTIVRYLAPRASPLTLLLSLDADAEHIRNLARDSRASLTIGATDPPGLVAQMRQAGRVPARLSLLVSAHPLDHSEVVYTARQVQKTYSGTPGYPKPPDADTLGHSMVGYSCSLVSARYVDTVGAQHTVPVLDMDGAIVDPLGPPVKVSRVGEAARGQSVLLEEFNGDSARRQAAIAFCGVYMGVAVSDALLVQADRLGFTLLGHPISADLSGRNGQSLPWREFRFSFSRETKTLDSFMSLLGDMEREAEEAAEKISDPSL